MGRRLMYDVETNGLLPTMDRIHCLVILDIDTKEWFIFRRNDEEDTIAEGVKMLEEADARIGHNIIGFDEKAVRKVFPDYDPQGECIDTLIMVRTLPVNFKEKDAALVKEKKMPGILMGKHSLDSWGYRLGKHKGDYSKQMKKQGLDPWASWNQDMEDYCVNDVVVNHLVWQFLERYNLPPEVLEEEQEIQSLVTYMEQLGYPFDVAAAEKLAGQLQSEFDGLVAQVSKDVSGRFVPEKKRIVKPIWIDPDGINEGKTYAKPNKAWGEDYSRTWWADITVPTKTMKSTDPEKRGDRTEGAAYCKFKWQDFKPTSRTHIREYLSDKYGWQPTEWTEKGNPTVDEKVLHELAERIPEAEQFATIFTLQKLLGYLVHGSEAWIKKYNEETGCVHPYTNTGGTVTGRCSHAGPNIAQVPSVIVKDDVPLKGRAGRWGWECRSLFYTPDLVYDAPWKQIGTDLSGIEFRMLAEETSEFDDGELIEVVLSGDIHSFNMQKTGINDRSMIKRVTYALLYGAGDYKLGMTAAPDASPDQWMMIGRRVRAQMMEGLPALAEVINKIKREAARGFITAIDGRKLYVRSEHSALNTKLQSSGAIIAKRWCVFTEQMLMEKGLDHGWEGDFCFLAFVHDELQKAAKEEYAETVADAAIAAAKKAGEHYGLRVPIDAEAKIGHNWAECH